jgi:hypothetical protein
VSKTSKAASASVFIGFAVVITLLGLIAAAILALRDVREDWGEQ